jgi:hypothetical protein
LAHLVIFPPIELIWGLEDDLFLDVLFDAILPP